MSSGKAIDLSPSELTYLGRVGFWQASSPAGDFVMVKKNDLESAERLPTTVDIPTETLLLSPDPIIRVAEIVFPGHANHRGILHGGPAMGWLAKAGLLPLQEDYDKPW